MITLPATLAKRANHFMTEFSRVNEALEAYRQGDIEKLGAVMFAHCPSYGNGTSEKLFQEGLCIPSSSIHTDEEL